LEDSRAADDGGDNFRRADAADGRVVVNDIDLSAAERPAAKPIADSVRAGRKLFRVLAWARKQGAKLGIVIGDRG
jgi:hypothetical protein